MKFSALGSRVVHPRTTVRWRLTLLYGGLFLASGAALLAVTYTLADSTTITRTGPLQGIVQHAVNFRGRGAAAPPVAPPTARKSLQRLPPGATVPAQLAQGNKQAIAAFNQFFSTGPGRGAITYVGTQQRVSDLHQLIIESSIALAVMALISAALGWVVAGRVLRPLRTMTATTQQISEASLDRRLAMHGPRDELRQLADTIDGLLERLEAAFNAQRRFVANASHELRTPLTAARAMLEMIISDPRATVETFRATCEQVLDENEQQEELIDALLALAQGQRGIEHREPIDLAEITAAVLDKQRAEARLRGLDLDVSLEPALVSGDARLIQRLVSNVIENAIRHNVPAGRVGVRVAPEAGRAGLVVVNTGPIVAEDQIERLLQPFQRLSPDRVTYREGLGLGLSIVAAIANAHAAALDVSTGSGGGLDVEVRFPRPLDSDRLPTPPGDLSASPPRPSTPQTEPVPS